MICNFDTLSCFLLYVIKFHKETYGNVRCKTILNFTDRIVQAYGTVLMYYDFFVNMMILLLVCSVNSIPNN